MNPSKGVPVLLELRLPRGLSHVTNRLMTLQDIETLLDFRQQIFLTLPKEFRFTDPDCEDVSRAELDWAHTYLGHHGVTMGVFHKSTLIAYASLLLPGAEAGDEISQRLGLSNRDIERSAHMASCMVAEDFRGLGLQSKLLTWRLQMALMAGRSLIVAMTACGNLYSLRNMFNLGMSIRWIGELKPHRWWQILVMDLQLSVKKAQLVKHEWVKCDNYSLQAMLTKQGFEGVAEVTQPGVDGKMGTLLEFTHRATLTPAGIVDTCGR